MDESEDRHWARLALAYYQPPPRKERDEIYKNMGRGRVWSEVQMTFEDISCVWYRFWFSWLPRGIKEVIDERKSWNQ